MMLHTIQQKLGLFNRFILLFLSVFVFKNGYTQSAIDPDSIKLKAIIKNDSEVLVTIKNMKSKDTLEMFNTYINSFLSSNRYLIRNRLRDSSVAFSYLPLTNFLGTVNSDLVYTNDDVVFKRNQLKYSFFEILPNEEQTFLIKIGSYSKVNSKIIDFDPNLSNIKKVRQKSVRYDPKKVIMVFAFYSKKDIIILSKFGAEFSDNNKFRKAAKSYVIKEAYINKM